MKWFARFNNFNLSKDIYDPAKFNSYPNVDLNNKPFACGELATSGSIQDPDNPTQSVTTCQYYNNYDISHHNEIWGSAFIGNFHSGFTWFADASHKWHGANPKKPGTTTALELGDPFTLLGTPGPYSDVIKSTFHNFRPFADYIGPQPTGADIDFSSNYTPYALYDYESTGLEAYYMVNDAKTNVYGWVHNMEHYWNNEYYYNEFNFQWDLCTSPTLASFSALGYPWNIGLPIYGLDLGSAYEITYYYTRMGPYAPFLPGTTTIYAGFNNGSPTFPNGPMAFIPASHITDFIACDTMHADFAFKLQKLGMRASETTITTKQDSLPLFTVFPNPTSNQFYFSAINGKSLKEAGVYRISVLDISGKIMLEKEIGKENVVTISLNHFSPGLYILEIFSTHAVQFQKIVKQ